MRSWIILATAFGSFQAVVGRGSNDWSKPCFNGECAWDMPDASGHAGSLKLWGPPAAISDITPASGWVILDCDPNRFEQVIRMTCTSDSSEGHGCAHLLDNGAEHKIVRLPESCGSAPFARISKVWVAQEQTIPSEHNHKVTRRDGVRPQVLSVAIDSNWDAVDASKYGRVKFAMLTSSSPTMKTDFQAHDGILDKHTQGADFIEHALQMWRDDSASLDSADGDIFTYNKGEKEFEVNFKEISGKIGLNKKHSIVAEKLLNCSGLVDIDLKLDVTPKFEGKMRIGIAGSGHLTGGSVFDTFQGYAKLDATLAAQVDLYVALKGKVGTGKLNIIPEVPIPPTSFTIPKIITIGTHFALFAEASIDMGWSIGVGASIGWDVKGAELLFPWGDSAREGSTKWKDTDITFKAFPTIMEVSTSASASVSGELRLGITLFSDEGPSTHVHIGAGVKASAKLEASIQGHVSASLLKDFGTLTNNLGPASSLGGCTKVTAGLDIYVGADLPFLAFWTDPEWKRSLWNPEFQIYKNCWGIKNEKKDSKKKKRLVSDVLPRSTLEADAAQKFTFPTLQLGCPDSKSGTKALQAKVDQIRADALKLLRGGAKK